MPHIADQTKALRDLLSKKNRLELETRPAASVRAIQDSIKLYRRFGRLHYRKRNDSLRIWFIIWSRSSSQAYSARLILGQEKYEISYKGVKFLGQLVDELGVRPDPEKVRAIQQMKTSNSELIMFLGMVNQQSKFSLHLAIKQNWPIAYVSSSYGY